MTYTHEREVFIARIFWESHFGTFNDAWQAAQAMLKDAQRLKRINERECNGYRDEATQQRDARSKERIITRWPQQFPATFHGDPRGPSVVLTLPSGISNNIGGGWAVPTRY